MGLWSKSKDFVRRASGARGSYQANRELRRSGEFVWPEGSQVEPGLCFAIYLFLSCYLSHMICQFMTLFVSFLTLGALEVVFIVSLALH